MSALEDQGQEDNVIRPMFGRKAKNWATDQRVVNRIKTEIDPMVQYIRDRRKPLNEYWTKLFRVWSLEHDEDQGYMGRSNVYMPSGQRSSETIVSQLVSGTFPGDDNFGVEARFKEWAGEALFVKEVLRYFIERVAKVRVGGERFYRQLVTLGNSPAKIHWVKKQRPGIRRDRFDEGIPADSFFMEYDGPVFEVLDAGNVYFWPENADSPDDCDVVFEDLTISGGQLRDKANRGVYVKDTVQRLIRGLRNSDKEHADVAKLQGQGFTSPSDLKRSGAFAGVDITELYCPFDPRAVSWEEEDEPVNFFITLAGGEVLSAKPVPSWYGKHPYVLGRMKLVTNRLYGTGIMDAIRNLSLLLNDQVNQGMDAVTLTIAPPMLVNPNAVFGTLADMEPGVQWLVNDINQAVKNLDLGAGHVINNTSILTAQTQAWIMEGAGSPPVLQGGSAPGRAFRTATGIGTANQNAKLPLQEIIRLVEAEVWEPMLSRFHSLAEQWGDHDFMIYMNGGKDLYRFPPKMLAGDWMFRWLASTQTDNKMVKSSSLMELINLLTSPVVQQALLANGARFNPVPLVKRLYQEVHGYRDVDEVLIMDGAGFQQQPPINVQGQPGAQPGQPMNLPEGLAENQDFLGTREDADMIAAGMGNMPTGGMEEMQ